MATATITLPVPASLATRCVLLKLDGVAWLRRRSVRAIRRLVEGGNAGAGADLFERGFEWVWNVATNPEGERRDLRFWSVEVIAPEQAQGRTLAQVIATILPAQRSTFPTGEICELFQWQHENVWNLRQAGQLPDCEFTPRAALEKFLKERLIR